MPTLAGVSVILSGIALTALAILGFVRIDAHQQAVAAADVVAVSADYAHYSGDPDACRASCHFFGR